MHIVEFLLYVRKDFFLFHIMSCYLYKNGRDSLDLKYLKGVFFISLVPSLFSRFVSVYVFVVDKKNPPFYQTSTFL